MKNLSLAKENITRYKSNQRRETVKTILYMIAEAITAFALFVLGYLYYSII
jgi:hypothetical protein